MVLYAFGVAGMSVVMGKTLPEAAALVTAFIPGDLLKAGIAGMLTASLAKARPGSVLSRA